MEMAQNDDELSSSTSEDEVAYFEGDTESFMQRKRDFMFSGLPPGNRGYHQQAHTVCMGRRCERPGQQVRQLQNRDPHPATPRGVGDLWVAQVSVHIWVVPHLAETVVGRFPVRCTPVCFSKQQ